MSCVRVVAVVCVAAVSVTLAACGSSSSSTSAASASNAASSATAQSSGSGGIPKNLAVTFGSADDEVALFKTVSSGITNDAKALGWTINE
jgi:hypothetical protein